MVAKTRFGIIGGGAVGGLYGCLLAKVGFDVHFLLRSDADHVRQHGWKIETPLGDFQLAGTKVHVSADTMPPCDYTVIALKTTQNRMLQELLPAPTSEGGRVLVLQNGLDVERDAAVQNPRVRRRMMFDAWLGDDSTVSLTANSSISAPRRTCIN